MKTEAGAATGKRKHKLLPLLVVLFVISYGLLTTLVVEQNKTIASQRTLIHLLFKDSLHLSALRKAERQKAHAAQGIPASDLQPNMKAPSEKIPVIQVPQEQVPQEQVQQEKGPSAQVPSVKPKQQNGGSNDHKQKAQKKTPNRPPAEVTDPSDMRRVSFSI